MADNDNVLADEDGEYRDWIELYNTTASPVDLTGWFLTDDPTDLVKWQFPATTNAAHGFLVIFASNKDRAVSGSQLHTNFKLSTDANSYVALVQPDGETIEHAYTYPEQAEDISYGISEDRLSEGYMATPTPGAANVSGYDAIASAPLFSHVSGTYTSDFAVTISSGDVGAVVRYTLNGSLPTEASTQWTNPIPITGTVQIRARVYAPDMVPSPIVSHSYIRLASDVFAFSSDLPILVLENFGAGNIPTETLQNSWFGIFEAQTQRSAFTNMPSLTSRSGMRRRGSSTLRDTDKKPCLFVETWDEDANTPRNIEPLGLPTESDWILFAPWEFDRAMMRNSLIYDLSNQLGVYAARTRFVEVFLNVNGGDLAMADYNGVYVLMEKLKRDKNRIDIAEVKPTDTAEPDITGGYILKIDRRDPGDAGFTLSNQPFCYAEPEEVEMETTYSAQDTWLRNYLNNLDTTLGEPDFKDPTTGYPAYVDIEASVDHHILNILAKNPDALRLSTYLYKDREEKLAFGPIWDFDRTMGSHDARSSNPTGWSADTPMFTYGWWNRFFDDPDFWQVWIDRWQEHRKTAITPDNIQTMINTMSNQLAEAQARNFDRWTVYLPSYGGWEGEVAHLESWLTSRIAWIDSQFINAPVFSHMGGVIPDAFALTISAPAGTSIYYTTNGLDPRASGGAIAGGAIAYTQPISINANTIIKARATDGSAWVSAPASTPWSGLTQATFIRTPPTLAISEIMYNPREPTPGTMETNFSSADFEFVELHNTDTQTTSLVGVRFEDGITFDFTYGNVWSLEPDARVIAVNNRSAFEVRYDNWDTMNIAGEFDGDLDNAGETVLLTYSTNDILAQFTYDDGRDWPLAADGAGHTMLPLSEENQTNGYLSYGGNWRASAFIDGSPGSDDPTPIHDVLINEVVAHTDYSNAALPEYDSDDWIELYNTSASDAGLSDWYLSDDADDLKKWAIPASTIITGKSWCTFSEVEDFHNPINTGFGLNKAGEQVFLSYLPGTDQDRVADCVRFKGQENGMSYGRYEDGQSFWYALIPTTNAANGRPTERIMISEIMFHPAPTAQNPEDNTNDEYIEIYSPLRTETPLWTDAGSWRIDGGVSYTFPSNTTLAGGSTLLLVSFDPDVDVAAKTNFLAAHGFYFEPRLFGPYKGKLSNTGERIAIEKPQLADTPGGASSWVIVDEVIYSAFAPWPEGANGTGTSLVRTSGILSGNDPSSWSTSMPTSPGVGPTKLALVKPENDREYLVPFTAPLLAEADTYQVSGTVSKVEFFYGDDIIATDTNGTPYEGSFTSTTNPGTYVFSARIHDDAGVFTSAVSVVHGLGPLVVYNAGASNITDISADLYGRFEGEGIDYATMTLYWGTTDGGSNKNNWAHNEYLGTVNTNSGQPHAWINGLTPGTTYAYRWHATRAQGEQWSETAGYFTTLDYADWAFHMDIAFDGYTGSETLTNFPALVKLHEGIPGFSYSQFASESGHDLRFDGQAGGAPLSYDIESWNTSGTSYVWVRIPEFSTTTVIRAHWGYAQAAQAPLAYTTDGSTWSEGYAAVWHLNGNFEDATLQNSAAVNSGSSAADGAVAGGRGFDGVDDVLTHAPSLGWYGQNRTHLTVTFWARPTASGSTVFGSEMNTNTMGHALNIYTINHPRIRTWRLAAEGSETQFGPYDLSQWQQLALVMEGSTILAAKNDEGLVLAHTNTDFNIAYVPVTGNKNGGESFFEGGVDEIRMSTVARSAEWIAAEYATVGQHDTFTDYGEVVDDGPQTDADNNGLPDAWELHFFQTTGVATNAHGDSDPMDNYSEYVAGTDPTNSDDYFSLGFGTTSGAPFVWFSMRPATNPFYTDLSRNYALETARALTNGAWYRLPDASNLPAMDGIFTYTNVHPLTDGGRFYRGRVWLHPDE